MHPVSKAKLASRLLLLSIVLVVLVLPFTPFAGKIKRGLGTLVDKARETKFVTRDIFHDVPVDKTVIKEVIREVPAPPPPLPSKFVPKKETDVATLFNGITIKTKLETSEGTYATLETNDPDSFVAEFQVKVRVPKANDTIPELARVNSFLPQILPGLPVLLANGKVSGFYHQIYENKVKLVEKNVTRLNKMLDKHNFFDTETILELEDPHSKRKAMLIQSDMDVVTDGSDGDRMPSIDSSIYNSDFYQPFTSYEWAKSTQNANPLLGRIQSKLESCRGQFSQRGLSAARNTDLKAQIQDLEWQVKALKSRSSLISEKDPFIVIPLLFKDYPRIMPQAPSLGDYCVVIHGNKVYPAICGDYGPAMKMGEASLMIARQVNQRVTPNSRGEDDLKVTYLIFPGTADKPWGPPNLDKWYDKISGYLKDIGGLGDGFTLHKWENPFPPKTVPAPSPSTELLAKVVVPDAKTTPDTTLPATPETTPAPVTPLSLTPGTATPPPAQPEDAQKAAPAAETVAKQKQKPAKKPNG